jgi:hypothetical protein
MELCMPRMSLLLLGLLLSWLTACAHVGVQPSTWFPLHICGVKPTVSEESQFSQQVCGVEAKHTLHTCEPPC